MEKFDPVSPKQWISTFIPGAVLAFDIVMLFDLFTIGVLSPFVANSLPFWAFFIVLSLLAGPTQAFIVHLTVKSPLIKWIVQEFCVISGMKKRAEELEPLYVIGNLFANMVVPALMFGMLFPDFLERHFLQPFFFFMMLGFSFLFLVLSLFAYALVIYE